MLHRIIITLFVTFCAISPVRAIETPSISPQAFGTLPELSNVQISLDGKKILMLENRNGQVVLVTRWLDGDGRENVIPVPRGRYNWAVWVSDDRILASVRDIGYVNRSRSSTQRREHYLYSMAWDGEEIRNANRLLSPRRGVSRFKQARPQFQDQLIDILKDDPDHVLLQLDLKKPGEPSVYKLNVKTGKRTRVLKSRRSVDFWMTDQNHIVRYGEGYYEPKGKNSARHVAYYRKSKDGPWLTLFDYDELVERRPFYFEGFSENGNIVYITADDENGVRALYSYDVDRKTRVEKIVGDPKRNIVDVSFSEDLSLNYHIYYHEKPEVIRHGERGEAINGIVQEHFKDHTVSVVSEARDKNRIIVDVTSPTMPLAYYFIDIKEKMVKKIGQTYRTVDLGRLSDKVPIFYQARDGLEIPAYLSLPKEGGKNLPTIIMPHGGPMGRDLWDFDYWVQFLTSRGFAVLQMNYRGSTGYGEEFRFKGYHEWGRKMLHDINDGTRYLIDRGIADPERICMLGGSYGGYAALQSAVIGEHNYQCVAALAPVTDLPALLHDFDGITGLRSYKDYVESDDWTLEEASPINHADKINVPILVIQGGSDVNVPPSQSQRFNRRMLDAGKDIRYVELEDGDHFLSSEKHRVRFLTEIETFLNKHLK